MSQSRTFVLRDDRAMGALRDAVRDWRLKAAMEQPITVTVAAYKARRNGDQNRLLHALINEIADNVERGGRKYEPEVWKELIRRQFIGTEEVDLPDGTRITRGLSTTTLSVGEFSDLIDRVTAWAVLELGMDTTLTL